MSGSEAGQSALTRPELSMPEAEAAMLAAEIARARVILEYGTGGSTVLAAEQPGKRIFGVESDPAWAQMMRDWFAQNPPASPVVIHHADIGPVKAWGMPVDASAFRQWPDYPHSVWGLDGFEHPDLVLIDGRFRAATFVATALRITKPVVVLFDDYVPRPVYHVVERFGPPLAFAGRMARFELQPQAFSGELAGWYASLALQPK